MKKILTLIITLFLVLPAYAKNDDKGKSHSHSSKSAKEHKDNSKQLPPGLAKKVHRGGDLPPGWQKKLVRGDKLGSDLYHRGVPVHTLPKGYNKKPGTEIIQIQDRMVRIIKDTMVIIDILN